jgi:hypothetical protein
MWRIGCRTVDAERPLPRAEIAQVRKKDAAKEGKA